MRLRRKIDRDEAEQWQPRLYAILIGLALAIAYLIAFVVENSTEVPVHWVFGTTHGSLIWVIVVSLAIGILVGVLLSQLYRRRWRRSHPVAEKAPESGGEPLDADRDLGG
ncbi:MAG TPA: LapA family protein [Gaiellaceae bacterium]